MNIKRLVGLALFLLVTLSALGQKPELYVQTGPVSPVHSVVYSPDGRILASGNGDGTIKLWDMSARREIRTLTGHKDAILSVAFSSDGRLLASGSEDRTVKLWDVTTGQVLKTLERHSARVIAVAFSPNSKVIASWSVELILWDVATGQELRRFKGCGACNIPIAYGQVSMPLSFSPDGKVLAASIEGDLKLLDVATGKKLKSPRVFTDVITFSPDGKMLASSMQRAGEKDLIYEIGLYDTTKGKLLHTLTGHTENISGIVFSPDGKLLASTSYDRTVRLWDVATGQELRTLRGRLDKINSIAFSPDGRTLVGGSGFAPGTEGRVLTGGMPIIGSSDNKIYLWDVATGQELPQLAASDGSVFGVIVSPDRKLLASARSDTDTTTVSLWDIAKGQKRQTFRFPFWLFSIAFSPDAKMLAGACQDKTAKLWDVATGQVLRSFAGHTDTVFSVALSPDGKTLATGSADQTIKLWDVTTGQELRTLRGHAGEVFTVAFSPDGRLLASGGTDRTCRLWDVATGTMLRIWSGHASFVRAVAFSPDGAMLASREEGVTVVHDDRHTVNSGGVKLLIPDFVQLSSSRIKLWDVASGQEMRTLEGDADALFAIAFSRDGKRLASNSYGGAVKVWDVSTGQVIRTLTGHAGEVHGIAFGLDENQLLSADDSSLYLWDIQTSKLLANLVTLDGRDGWLVVTPDGLFDGPWGWNQIIWRFSQLTFDYAPVEAFFGDFYYPELLADLCAGIRPTAKQQIENKDRRQPQLKVLLPVTDGTAVTSRTVKVTVQVQESLPDVAHASGSGARDVRLFRNGSLVKVWRGDLTLNGEGKTDLEATVPIIAGDNQLTAYAFNHDDVKSLDATAKVVGAETLQRKGTVFIVTIGVNNYSNPQYNLKYAVPDARDFGEELQRQQISLGRFANVEMIPLLDKNATKGNILLALKRLAGNSETLPAGAPEGLRRIKPVQPEDAVVIYFAGHGTAQQNQFYLIPYDLGYTGSRTNLDSAGLQQILAHGISDRELQQAFEQIDVGQMLLVIDACNSGQALEAEEKRRGPMNSKGLAQLAYEKGMYILTAAQSYQLALEAFQLGHGYLTYALVEEGLKTDRADIDPRDGQVTVREWLDFATERVPQMQQQLPKPTVTSAPQAQTKPVTPQRGQARRRGQRQPAQPQRQLAQEGAPTTTQISPEDRQVQRPRVFYRRETKAQPLIVARP